jgi:hypothetical protein
VIGGHHRQVVIEYVILQGLLLIPTLQRRVERVGIAFQYGLGDRRTAEREPSLPLGVAVCHDEA